MSFTFERPVHFEDVDAAGIVFFARFFLYCHDAMVAFFGDVEGGYSSLIVERKLGFPTVHVDCDFMSPLRYGDVARIEVSIKKIGTTSVTFEFDFWNMKTGAHVAKATQTSVSTDLRAITKTPIPADVRAILEKHQI
jgi:4-hydroxybenzoyl-CoA thioesterase